MGISWNEIGGGTGLLGTGYRLSEHYKNRNSGTRDPGRDIPFRGGTGTGSQFLSTMGTGYEGVAGGSDWENRGPELQKSFLQGEMGPGGFLSSGQQSLEGASRVNSIYQAGRQGYRDTLNGLGSAGLSRRYALPIAQQSFGLVADQAGEALSASMGESNMRRFQAMMAYVNSAAQSAWEQKQSKKNYNIAKKAGKNAEGGGMAGGIGSVVGGIASAFSDRRVKKNVEHVGVEGGHNVYEFEYKGALAKQLPGRYRGVMADEVQLKTPEAVSQDRWGRKKVDYTFLGTKMKRVS